MKLDLRRRSTGSPSAYIPGLSTTTPPSCRRCPFASDDGHVEPAVVGTKAGRPDDRSGSRRCADRCRAATMSGARVGSKRSGSPTSPVAAVGCAPTRRRCRAAGSSSDRPARTCSAARRRRAPGRRGPPRAGRPARRPIARQRVEIERRALGRADELRRRQAPRARQVVDLVVALIPHARARPSTTARRGRDTCAAAGRARRPTSVTGRPERWISSASCTPVADAPTTSTPPSGSCDGIAIVERRDLLDRRRHRAAAAPARSAGCRRRSRARRSGSGSRRRSSRRGTRRRCASPT